MTIIVGKKLLKLKVSNWGLINTESLELAIRLEKRGLINFRRTLSIFIIKGMGGNPHHTSFGTDVLLSGAFLNEVYRICKDPTFPTLSELTRIFIGIPELKTRYRLKYDKFGNWSMTLKCSKKELKGTDWKKFNWHLIFDVNGQFEYFFVKGLDFPILLKLFRYLNGNYGKNEILKSFQDHHSLVSEFLDFAKSRDLLVTAEVKPRAKKTDSFFKFTSHSCLQFSTSGHSIIIDPAFLVPPQFQDQRGAFDHFTDNLPTLTDATAIVITHHHWDHLNLQTLVRFPRDIPIYIPKPFGETFFNPSIKNYLKSLGFQKIKTIRHWEKIKVNGMQLTAIPFRGEWFGPGSHFDAFCYLVEYKGQNFLGSFDADRDERGTMVPIFKKLKARGNKIDFFFFGSSAKVHKNPTFCADPYMYSSKYKQQYKNRMRYHPDGETVYSWCEILKPSIVIPYAEFIFHNQNIQGPTHLNHLGNFDGRFKQYWQKGLTTKESEILKWKGSLQILKNHLQRIKINMLMLGPGETIKI